LLPGFRQLFLEVIGGRQGPIEPQGFLQTRWTSTAGRWSMWAKIPISG
jgi:hypothetical protein